MERAVNLRVFQAHRSLVGSLGALSALVGVISPATVCAQDSRRPPLTVLAENAYRSSYDAWLVGAADGEEMYRWSLRWMNASIATTRDWSGRISAARAHAQRMIELFRTVKMLDERSVGTRDRSVAAARFYVAEASAVTRSLRAAPGKWESRSMVDSAEEAFETAHAHWTFRTGGPEMVYTWSKRWLKAASTPPTTARERVAAAARHVRRIEAIFDDVMRADASGKEPLVCVAAARYYLADAKMHLLQVSRRAAGPSGGDAAAMAPDTSGENHLAALASEAYGWFKAKRHPAELRALDAGDPESLFRWSLRWMNAASYTSSACIADGLPARQHHQRMALLLAAIHREHEPEDDADNQLAAARYYAAASAPVSRAR